MNSGKVSNRVDLVLGLESEAVAELTTSKFLVWVVVRLLEDDGDDETAKVSVFSLSGRRL